MSDLEYAAKLALEALNKLTDAAGGFSVSGVYFNEGVWEQECLNAAYDAIKALEEALAKQEQGEPVAWTIDSLEQEIYENTRQFVSLNVMEWLLNRLNTTPQPAQKPLTDEQILRLLSRIDECAVRLPRGLREFARAIEAAHGIKENT